MRRLFSLLAFSLIIAYSGDAQSLSLKLGDYSINGYSSSKKEAGALALVQAVVPGATKGSKTFGFWYAEDAKAMTNVVLEISDAKTNSAIKKLTASDFGEKSKSEMINSGEGMKSTYQFGAGTNAVEIQVVCESVKDETAPLGKKLALTYKVMLPKSASVNAQLRLKTDGSAQKLGSTGIATVRTENNVPAYPAIVLSSLNPLQTDVSARSQGIQQVSLSAENIDVKAKAWTTLFSLEVTGTTVNDPAKAMDQANRITNRVAAKESKPELAIFNSASPASTVPGDTVTYTITYCNIGNGLAQNAEISNEVPEGVMLIENSVEAKDAEVVIDRKQATAPEVGTPIRVRWKLTKKIMPGEEGTLTMKVIVR
ncbi:MAG TPA: DUF11 domain-containing protein [Bacteroidota bacterium]|nr:DUF11 domain-containing protein [Bacteroidota bacterium]